MSFVNVRLRIVAVMPLVLTVLLVGPVRGQDFTADGVTFVGRLDISQLGGTVGTEGNDLWGWTDQNGKEFAIFGRTDGTAFVDISDPENPTYLGNLPSFTGVSIWRDIKVYNDYAFIVSDNNGPHGMQIFDLTQLSSVTSPMTFTETARDDSFRNAHNVAINEDTGFAYVVGSNQANGGLHVIDISDPLNPVVAGEFSADGYTHDVQVVTYAGPDTAYAGQEIAFASNEDSLTIVDVTNKAATSLISKAGYPLTGYNHQGWLSEDQRFFFQNDEKDEFFFGGNTRTHVWDLEDLDNPDYVGFFELSTTSIDHNLYVKDDLIFEANYTSGLRVLKINDAATLDIEEIGFFDTLPSSDGLFAAGLWSVYPYFESGNIILSDINKGLYIVRLGNACDLNGDDLCNLADIDLLTEEGDLSNGVDPSDDKFDLNGDGVVDELDIDAWLAAAGPANGLGGPYLVGDANLDGTVDETDFDIWNAHRFEDGTKWSLADFNGSGATDLTDLHKWNENKFTSTPPGMLVPEPTGLALVLVVGGAMFWRLRE